MKPVGCVPQHSALVRGIYGSSFKRDASATEVGNSVKLRAAWRPAQTLAPRIPFELSPAHYPCYPACRTCLLP